MRHGGQYLDPSRSENAAGRADYSLQIYALLSLELWSQTFLDRPWRFDEHAGRPLVRHVA